MTKKAALDSVGGLSKPSKMPGHGWSIPATLCKTGSKLAKIPGSVCNKCYALKGRYVSGNVKSALHRRLDIYNADSKLWADNMVSCIKATTDTHFRWFDSGDLQSVEMLRDIVAVANRTPDVYHWLPTKEPGIVKRFIDAGNVIPRNLNIRISAPMIDDMSNSKLALHPQVTMSGVSSKGNHTCPASTQGNKCGDCRACWDVSVPRVVYPKH